MRIAAKTRILEPLICANWTLIGRSGGSPQRRGHGSQRHGRVLLARISVDQRFGTLGLNKSKIKSKNGGIPSTIGCQGLTEWGWKCETVRQSPREWQIWQSALVPILVALI
jgi:hypothetical protein